MRYVLDDDTVALQVLGTGLSLNKWYFLILVVVFTALGLGVYVGYIRENFTPIDHARAFTERDYVEDLPSNEYVKGIIGSIYCYALLIAVSRSLVILLEAFLWN